MVRAWLMNETNEDQREPHMPDPPSYLSLEEVGKKTGVKYYKIDFDTYEANPEFLKLKADLGLTYEDTCDISREKLENYDEMLKRFFKEHIHSDDEIRFCQAGSGYFDVRDNTDKWIRIEMVKDDLLIIPAGIYHRFTLDTQNYIKVKRMFAGVPVWTPIDRPADDHPVRKAYVQQMASVRG